MESVQLLVEHVLEIHPPGEVWNVKQNLSTHALILPFLEMTPVYNSFNFGSDEDVTVLAGMIESTASFTSIKTFQCPSDPLAGAPDYQGTTNTNSYYCSVGTTMYWSQIGTAPYGTNQPSVNLPSTGLFTFQASYGLSNCVDGSSNTIAFAEAAVGSQSLVLGQKLSGVVSGAGLQPYEVLDASSNLNNAKAALQVCQTAWSTKSGGSVDTQRGDILDALQSHRLGRPVGPEQCRQLPPRRRQRDDGRRQLPVRQGLDQHPDLDGPRHQEQWRGHLRR
jgi:hypothetical protein